MVHNSASGIHSAVIFVRERYRRRSSFLPIRHDHCRLRSAGGYVIVGTAVNLSHGHHCSRRNSGNVHGFRSRAVKIQRHHIAEHLLMIPDPFHLKYEGRISEGCIIGSQSLLNRQGSVTKRLLRLQTGCHNIDPGVVSRGIIIIVRKRYQIRSELIRILRGLYRLRFDQIHSCGEISHITGRLSLRVRRDLKRCRRFCSQRIRQGNSFLCECFPLFRRRAVADRPEIQRFVAGQGRVLSSLLHISNLVQIHRDRSAAQLLILSVQFKGQ